MLAGLSVDYLIRLEQGRATNPSPQVVAALGRALKLTGEEWEALHRLVAPVPTTPGDLPNEVTTGVRRLFDLLEATPAAVVNAGWDLLRWNNLWTAVLGDPDEWQGWDRNLAWRHFTGVAVRVHEVDLGTNTYEREIVADLRLAVAKFPEDPRLAELVTSLQSTSDQFNRLWDRFDLQPRGGGREVIDHETAGPLVLDCDVLTVAGSDLKIKLYTAAPGSREAGALDELRQTTGLTAGWLADRTR